MKKTVKICLVALACALAVIALSVINRAAKGNPDDAVHETTSEKISLEENSGTDAADAETEKTPLNEMTKQECYQTLAAHGFELPEEWKSTFGEFDIEYAKSCVDYIYSIGGDGHLYGYPAGTELGLRVYKTVCEYEGWEYPFESIELYEEPVEENWSAHPLCAMTEEECYKTLLSLGIELPEEWQSSSRESIQKFVKRIVNYTYRNGWDCPAGFGLPANTKFAYRIVKAVCEYEGVEFLYEEDWSDDLK